MQSLFGNESTDPRLFLLNKTFAELPEKDQIAWVIYGIRETALQDEKTTLLLDVLQKLFKPNEAIRFREHLRKLYGDLPGTKTAGRTDIKEDASPKLKLAILSRILSGWHYIYDFEKSDPHKPHLWRDAEVCFLFVCEAYKAAYPKGTLQREIPELVRDHFRTHPMWRAQQLDPWILREETPDAIAEVLLHAQIRIGEVRFAKERIRSLSPQE